MSVFADILVLAALIAAAWLGARRGLLKSLAGLLIVVVALVIINSIQMRGMRDNTK